MEATDSKFFSSQPGVGGWGLTPNASQEDPRSEKRKTTTAEKGGMRWRWKGGGARG